MSWFDFITKLFCPDYLELQNKFKNVNSQLATQMLENFNLRGKMETEIPEWFKTEYSKYPTADITYKGREIKGVKPDFDVRTFIEPRNCVFQKVLKDNNLYLDKYQGETMRERYDNLFLDICKFLAPKLTYETDQNQFGFNECWMQPTETWALKKDDCFAGDTKIICLENNRYSIKKIKDLQNFKDIQALSYNFKENRLEFKPILNWWNKGKKEVVKVKVRNGTSFICTPEHKFFKWKVTKDKGVIEQKLCDFDLTKWYERQILCIKKLPELDIPFADPRKLWIYGQYLAEGWKVGNRVYVSGDNPEIQNRLYKYLDELGIKFSKSKRKKSSYIEILDKEFKKEFENLGINAFDKKIPTELLSESPFALNWFLEGYMLGDSYVPKNHKHILVHNTSSNQLAEDLRLIHWVLGRPLYSWLQLHHQGLGKNPIWRLYEDEGVLGNRNTLPDLSAIPIVSVEYAGEEKVFDIEVENNHNFVLAESGVLAHNCEGFTNLYISFAINAGIPYYLLRNCCGTTYDGYGHSTLYYMRKNNEWCHAECTRTSFNETDTLQLPIRSEKDRSNIKDVWFSFDARNAWSEFTTDFSKDSYNKDGKKLFKIRR